jgi:hypothetical protein
MKSPARPLFSALALLCALGISLSATAGPKDIDGKRTRARRTAVGVAVKDKLGPGDAADWRYVRVEGKGDLTISVTYEPGLSPVQLRITDAKGNVMATATTAKPGAREVTIAVSPGIYYIEVACADPASYTLDSKMT